MNEKERKLNKEEAGKVTGGTAEETGPEVTPIPDPSPMPEKRNVKCRVCGTTFENCSVGLRCPECKCTNWAIYC